jgi:ABC-type oligopeptide transport system ATPase subunit
MILGTILMALRNLLEVSDLSKSFSTQVGKIQALQGISFSLREGSTLGIVGESGSGKSTLGRCLIRLIEPDSGSIRFCDEDLTLLTMDELRLRRKDMQMIFQNPLTALNPRLSIRDNIEEALKIWSLGNSKERENEVIRLLELVGIPRRRLDAWPSELSGGQLQRVNIARALSVRPKLIICDEATSSLDVSVQAQIVQLLLELQKELKLTYIFISHNLGVVEYMSHEVMVLQEGKMKELAPTEEIYLYPKNPYTQSLIDSVPRMPTAESLKAKLEKRLLKLNYD